MRFQNGFYNGQPSNEFELLVSNFFFEGIRNRHAVLHFAKSLFELSQNDFVYQVGPVILMIQLSRKILSGD